MTVQSDGELLSTVGEKALVRLIQQTVRSDPRVLSGTGNDATALEVVPGCTIAITVDRCPTPLAYRIDATEIGVWGDLAITCVASDLFASGAEPVAFMLSLLLPRTMRVQDVIALVRCAERSASSLGACIAAGDTKEAAQLNVITCGIGRLVNGHVARRGARAGDLLVLTGEIGPFTAAQVAFSHGITKEELDSRLRQPVFSPEPAHHAARALLTTIKPTAGMDLSDGLLSTAFTLAEANGLGITLREADLPIAARAIEIAHRFAVDPLRLAFGTGDWQIAYAVAPGDWERISATLASRGQMCAIGTFTAEHAGVTLACKDGRRRRLRRIEQQHFLESWADRGFLEFLLETPLFE